MGLPSRLEMGPFSKAIATSIAVSAVLTVGCRTIDSTGPRPVGDFDVLWRADIAAFGPPAVNSQSIFFATRGHELVAIDRATGAVRWRRPSGVTGGDLVIHDSPVVSGDVVIFGDEVLHGFDATTGRRLWTYGIRGELPGVYAFRATASRLFAGSAVGHVSAVDLSTGAEVWRTPLVPGSDSQVRVQAADLETVYATVRFNGPPYQGRVYALSASSGEVRWLSELPRASGEKNGTKEAMLVSDAHGSGLVVVFDDGRIVRFDSETGAIRWTIPRRAELTTANDDRHLTVANGILVASGESPVVIQGFDLATGKLHWSTPSSQGSPEPGYGRLSSHGTRAFVSFWNGHIGAFDVETGRPEWVRRLAAGVSHGAPVASGDTLFLAAYQAAFAVRR